MSGIVRLFVGNTPHSAQKEDIHTLVSKICPVHDVYIPPRTITGLPRSFAIVEIKSDMKDLRKCLQLLNNTNWKGSRLRIEVARPFYVDRLQSERRLELEPAICTEDSPPYLDHEGTPDAATVEVPLVLKIKKSMAQTITVHTVPLDTKEPEEPPDPNRNSSFNKKIKYKPRKLGRALRFYFDDDGSRRVAPIALDVSGPPLEPSSAAKPVVAAAPIITKPLGGGAKQRMGFGFAAKDSLRADADEDTMACVQDPVAQKWHSKTVGGLSLNDGRFQDRFKGGEHAALDDYYEFAEHWEAPPERVEEEEEEAVMGPVVPSVAAEEVTEAFLAEERSRLLATLQRLSKRNPESSAVGADIDNPRPRVAQVATKSWGSAIVARYDPSAASAEVFLTKEKRAAAAESFDLNFEDSRPAETFANLAVLKDIFHPEVCVVSCFFAYFLSLQYTPLVHRSRPQGIQTNLKTHYFWKQKN